MKLVCINFAFHFTEPFNFQTLNPNNKIIQIVGNAISIQVRATATTAAAAKEERFHKNNNKLIVIQLPNFNCCSSVNGFTTLPLFTLFFFPSLKL